MEIRLFNIPSNEKTLNVDESVETTEEIFSIKEQYSHIKKLHIQI